MSKTEQYKKRHRLRSTKQDLFERRKLLMQAMSEPRATVKEAYSQVKERFPYCTLDELQKDWFRRDDWIWETLELGQGAVVLQKLHNVQYMALKLYEEMRDNYPEKLSLAANALRLYTDTVFQDAKIIFGNKIGESMINNILNIVNQQNGKQEVFMDGKPISTDPAELARHYEDAIEQICNATINRILMEQQVDTQDKQASLDRQPRQP